MYIDKYWCRLSEFGLSRAYGLGVVRDDAGACCVDGDYSREHWWYNDNHIQDWHAHWITALKLSSSIPLIPMHHTGILISNDYRAFKLMRCTYHINFRNDDLDVLWHTRLPSYLMLRTVGKDWWQWWWWWGQWGKGCTRNNNLYDTWKLYIAMVIVVQQVLTNSARMCGMLTTIEQIFLM